MSTLPRQPFSIAVLGGLIVVLLSVFVLVIFGGITNRPAVLEAAVALLTAGIIGALMAAVVPRALGE